MGLTSLINTGGLSGAAAEVRPVGVKLARDPFAPNFQIVVRGGQGAQADLWADEITQYIDEITYEDNADQFDMLTLTFLNQIDEMGGGKVLSLLDSKLVAEGTILEIKMGYGNSLRTVGAAQIIKRAPTFGSDGVSFSLECYDMLHNAARKRPVNGISYKSSRDSQIASIIGVRNGFDISVKDPRSFEGIRKTKGIFDRVQKKGVSDYEFLKKLADINGYDLYSKFNPELKKFSLFFQPQGLTKKNKEVFTFVYNEGDVSHRSSLIDFSPTLDAYDQSSDFEIFLVSGGGTKVNFINRLTLDEQKILKAEAERRFTGGNPGPQGGKQKPEDNGIKVAFKAFGRSFKFPPHKRFKNEADARRSIEEFIKRQKECFITGSGTLIGNEALQSRQVHNLQGMGEQFSGKYYFTKVVHTMKKGEGYSCSFDARKLIEDTIVQAPPGLTLSDTDRTLSKIKKESLKAVI